MYALLILFFYFFSVFFFLMIRRPPRSTLDRSSAASDVYKRQIFALSLLYGAFFVLPIGGADMPVVISLLNSFTGVAAAFGGFLYDNKVCLLYTSPSPRDRTRSRMPSSA